MIPLEGFFLLKSWARAHLTVSGGSHAVIRGAKCYDTYQIILSNRKSNINFKKDFSQYLIRTALRNNHANKSYFVTISKELLSTLLGHPKEGLYNNAEPKKLCLSV